ncbi:hypothetical protein SeMB42_g01949 [Synchytrium endobioticum]|uniref:Uncharacterized protein n=1 Tax=Synchytrium endobioticum TaxID=286115 RepID=A0A507DI42_9FUNG|nr:hypothetical protein SeMB42_g01949 [Synchytrium endobioticum]
MLRPLPLPKQSAVAKPRASFDIATAPVLSIHFKCLKVMSTKHSCAQIIQYWNLHYAMTAPRDPATHCIDGGSLR